MFFERTDLDSHIKDTHKEEGGEHTCKVCDGTARAPPGMYFKYIRGNCVFYAIISFNFVYF